MRVLFSAQDPGGKNAIAPVIEALKNEGAEVGENIKDPDIFIAGTSGGDSPDKHSMQELGETPSLYVLDFWSNYWQRFSTLGKKDFAFLPTRVCVMDDIAKEEMIAEGFPPERLIVTGNPHFDHFADAITRESEEVERILFISQPIRAVASLPGFSQVSCDEYTALKDILSILETVPGKYYLSIRLHPKEPADTYVEYLGPRVRRADEATLEEAISKSGLIIGISSPVLMQAVAAGKKVLSYEPYLIGKDPLVSNRVGVTIRIENKEALLEALFAYARQEWSFTTRSLREVWPTGATGRVVKVVHELAGL
ncbi:MAG: hypothetical protein NT108_00260 [Candidatus Kaiserbacteria bacterium]|nr:hypothetical protein [Candidatus Kaiserbacteria bacterium]